MKKKAKPKGKKFNKGKPMIHLIPEEAIFAAAQVFTDAVESHGKHNYRDGLFWADICDSLLRHTFKYLAGMDTDEDTGKPQTYHILANAMMLEFMRVNHPKLDNRYKGRKSTKHFSFRGKNDKTR